MFVENVCCIVCIFMWIGFVIGVIGGVLIVFLKVIGFGVLWV